MKVKVFRTPVAGSHLVGVAVRLGNEVKVVYYTSYPDSVAAKLACENLEDHFRRRTHAIVRVWDSMEGVSYYMAVVSLSKDGRVYFNLLDVEGVPVGEKLVTTFPLESAKEVEIISERVGNHRVVPWVGAGADWVEYMVRVGEGRRREYRLPLFILPPDTQVG